MKHDQEVAIVSRILAHQQRYLLVVCTIIALLLFLGILSLESQASSSAPILSDYVPSVQQLDVPLNSTIVLTYSTPLSATTVTSSTVPVYGMMSGVLSASYQVSDGLVTIDPTRDFFPGELVSTIATTDVTDIQGSHPLSSTVWQFTVAAHGGDGNGTAWISHTVVPTTATLLVNGYGDEPGVSYYDFFISPGRVVTGDIDGDGDIDAAVVAVTSDKIVWAENANGVGCTGWKLHLVSDDLENATDVALADIDGDGDLDILGSNEQSPGGDVDDITWWENVAGDGATWAAHVIEPTFYGAINVVAGDIDGDGDLDVVGTTYLSTHIPWWENVNGDGSVWIEHQVERDWATASELLIGDLDNDGDPDVLAASNNVIAWWENVNADATIWLRHTIITSTDGYRNVAVGDVDGDGALDVISAAVYFNAVTWWENPGSVSAVWIRHVLEDSRNAEAWDVDTGDFDGDGDLDLVVAAMDDGVTLWVNSSGDGASWSETQVDGTVEDLRYVASGDLDRDGDLDIIGSSQSGNYVMAWLNVRPAIRIQSDSATVRTAETITITLTLANTGPSAADGMQIHIPQPANLQGLSWACISSGGAVCPASSGNAAIDHTIAAFPRNGRLVYSCIGTIVDLTDPVHSQGAISPPSGIVLNGSPAFTFGEYVLFNPFVAR
jgi:hypothetical protein